MRVGQFVLARHGFLPSSIAVRDPSRDKSLGSLVWAALRRIGVEEGVRHLAAWIKDNRELFARS